MPRRKPELPTGRKRPPTFARRSTLDICGPGARRPGGQLFVDLCELADRFAARKRDPLARRVGVVLTHVALHSAQTGDEDDFRLALRSALDLLVETDPLERWSPAFARRRAGDEGPEAAIPQAPLSPGQPAPVPYPVFAGADLVASAEWP